MTEFELIGLSPVSKAQKLLAEAYPEYGELTEEPAYLGYGIPERFGVPRAV